MKIKIYLLFLLILTSCNIASQDDYKEQYVLESYLIANKPLPDIQLTTTVPLNEVYNKFERGVNDATITVLEFSPSGTTAENTYTYILEENGVYRPVSNQIIVKPRYRYDLHAVINSTGKTIRATTIVPDTFRINNINATSLVYQGATQFELELTPSFFPGRQGYYVFSTQTLDPENAEFTPFYGDRGEPRSSFYTVSSGVINESSTGQNGNGFVNLTFPWIGVAFYGPNRIRASAIDNNLYDLIRSAGTQTGGGTQSPGEIENIISNIDGGIGVFGSYAEITVDVEVLKP
jgi:hypothetical protein